MKMILTGTGTSHGIPVIACSCNTCTSTDTKNIRNRCAAFLTSSEENEKKTDIIIDCGQEFRIQAVRFGIKRLDAVLITHAHADHIFGLDDVRIFSVSKPNKPGTVFLQKDTDSASPMPVYTNKWTADYLRNVFGYAFADVKQGGGVPNFSLKANNEYNPQNPLQIAEVQIIPVPLLHGYLDDSGYLISHIAQDGEKHSIAYLTDCSSIPDSSISLINENAGTLDHVVIDALRIRLHSTHFSFDGALEQLQKINARHMWFTHICHDVTHEGIKEYIAQKLPEYPALLQKVKNGCTVEPAYDGLELFF